MILLFAILFAKMFTPYEMHIKITYSSLHTI